MWKTQFEPLLNCHDLKGFNDGTCAARPPDIPNPTTSVLEPNPAFSEWFRKDQTLFSYFLSYISEERFYLCCGP